MRRIHVVAFAGAFSLTFILGLAMGRMGQAQQTPPTQNVGVNTTRNVAIDLGPEIEGMAGRQLRLRLITLAPGGVFAVHSHVDRPTVEFVLSGDATEFRDNTRRVVREGEAILSDRHTTHWWRNDGATTVTFVAADIFRPQ